MSRKGIALTALLVMAACFSMPTKARADFELVLHTSDGAADQDFTYAGSSGTEVSAVIGVFDVQVIASTTSSSSAVSQLSLTVTNLTRNDGAGGTNNTSETLRLMLYNTGYTMPTSPVTLSSNLGITYTSGNTGHAGNSATEQAFLDTGNNEYETTPPTTSATVISPGSHTFSDNGGGTAQSFNNGPTGSIAYSPSYSLVNVISITLADSSEKVSSANVQANVVAAVPEPSTWMLSSAGVLFAGGAFWLRRKRVSQQLNIS